MRRTSRFLLVVLPLAATVQGQEPGDAVLQYGVPIPSEVHLDAYQDFLGFVERSDWSRAFRSIADQLESPPHGLLPSPGGVHLSYAERLRRDLACLPRDGRRAFRLYYDAKAERLWKRAEEEADPQARSELLSLIYLRYFPTSRGDQAADALARLAAEAGDSSQAATLWSGLLDHHRDTDLDRVAIGLDRCAAWAASGRQADFARTAEELELRWGEVELEWRGEKLGLSEALARIVPPAKEGDGEDLGPRLEMSQPPESRWRVDVGTWEVERSATSWVQSGGGDRPPMPAGVVVDDGLVVDMSGRVLCVAAASGQERWSAGSFPAQVEPFRLRGRLFASRAAGCLLVAGDAQFHDGATLVHLVCLDADSGSELWSTHGDEAFDGHSVSGRPAVDGDMVYVVMRRAGTYKLELCALALADGALQWRADLGSPVSAASSNPWAWSGSESNLPICPEVVVSGSEVLVVTDSCAVLGIDPDQGRMSWAYTQPVERRFEEGPSPGSSLLVDGVLYLRSQGNRNLFALDVAARVELWAARVEPSERLVAWDEDAVFLVGDNLRAVDRDSGERLWSRPIQVPSDVRHVVQTEDHLYVLTRRGLFEVEKTAGDTGRTPTRGVLSRMGGGDLFLVGEQLICVGRKEVVAIALGG